MADRKLAGKTTPRLFTPPLRKLTRATTHGYAIAEFADTIGEPLLPWQRWLVIHAMELNPDRSYRFRVVVVLVSRQNGKALECSMEILTANRGWTTMGELVTGDEVFHPDGHPVRVIAAHPVRLDRQCYRVTTTDGRSIIADAEHLWTVQDVRHLKSKGRRGERKVKTYAWETLTTVQLLERGLMRSGRECAYRLPRQRALISKPADLPLDPYLFGVWLGDGNSGAAVLSVSDADVDETAANIEATGARIVSRRRDHTAWRLSFSIGARHKDGFESRCRRMGVWGDKHIPDAYLTGGTEQRLALLQGLLDTDGSIFVGGGGSARVELCSTNRRLAEGARFTLFGRSDGARR